MIAGTYILFLQGCMVDQFNLLVTVLFFPTQRADKK